MTSRESGAGGRESGAGGAVRRHLTAPDAADGSAQSARSRAGEMTSAGAR